MSTKKYLVVVVYEPWQRPRAILSYMYANALEAAMQLLRDADARWFDAFPQRRVVLGIDKLTIRDGLDNGLSWQAVEYTDIGGNLVNLLVLSRDHTERDGSSVRFLPMDWEWGDPLPITKPEEIWHLPPSSKR